MATAIVLAKAPVAGRVKTRLCPPCTPEVAATIAEAALRDTLDAVRAAVVDGIADRAVVVLDGASGDWLSGTHDTDPTRGTDGSGDGRPAPAARRGVAVPAVLAQRGDGLAERLAAAFEDVFAHVVGVADVSATRGRPLPGSARRASGGAPSEPMVLVAMDTPQLRPEHLASAFAALGEHDAVLGPADDGGFWLIGLRAPDRRVFAGVPMSTGATGAAQLARLHGLGLRVALLTTLSDVDTVADLDALASAHPSLRTSRAWAAAGARRSG